MHIVFMVAEKPSLAESIAKSLSFNKYTSRKGFNGACSVHEWNGPLNIYGGNQNVTYKMTSVCGHVMGLNFHSRYNNWDATDPIELFSASTIQQEANPKLKMVEFLRKESRGSSTVVLWLDCDKEGENICFEVVDSIKESINQRCDILRARFSAITDTEIRGAMQRLVEPNKNEALSVDARQELDLRIGCAFTRFQTKFFQGKYGDLDSKLISYGPCQTPTLGFCVDRYDKIQSFKPESFWTIKAQVLGDRDKQVELEWARGRIFDKSVVNMLFSLVKNETSAKVTGISTKQTSRPKPMALNTVEMLRVASSGLGIGSHICMSVAERLYTQGYISYPRTETTHYPESFDLRGPLLAQRNNSELSGIVDQVLAIGLARPKKGHDAGDHPPITPMKSVSPGELSGDAARLYNYIARHYLATLLPDCKMEVSKITFDIGSNNDESWSVTSRKVLDPGWLMAMDWLNNEAEESGLSQYNIKEGQTLPLVGSGPWIHEGKTGPPDLLTESDLISLMEKHGIGTDASIPVHIQHVVERNYVTIVAPGRRLQPTKLGIVLVHGYRRIDAELVLPMMRGAVERQLELIAKGQADYKAVLAHSIAIFSAKFKYFVEEINRMNELFEDSFSSMSDTQGKPLTRCGQCNRYMKLISGNKTQRLYCGTCQSTYSLPSPAPNGSNTIRQYKQVRCPLDKFELVVYTQGVKSKSFVLCPYCYNYPPAFEDMPSKAASCNVCTHPDCSQSLIHLAVSACHECSRGLLILDDCNYPPRYKLQCNECSVLVLLAPSVCSVTLLTSSTCQLCNSVKMEIKLNPKNVSGDQTSSFSGCVFCDENMTDLLQLEHSENQRGGSGQNHFRGGRGRRGGGRGRRGRGRGGPR